MLYKVGFCFHTASSPKRLYLVGRYWTRKNARIISQAWSVSSLKHSSSKELLSWLFWMNFAGCWSKLPSILWSIHYYYIDTSKAKPLEFIDRSCPSQLTTNWCFRGVVGHFWINEARSLLIVLSKWDSSGLSSCSPLAKMTNLLIGRSCSSLCSPRPRGKIHVGALRHLPCRLPKIIASAAEVKARILASWIESSEVQHRCDLSFVFFFSFEETFFKATSIVPALSEWSGWSISQSVSHQLSDILNWMTYIKVLNWMT